MERTRKPAWGFIALLIILLFGADKCRSDDAFSAFQHRQNQNVLSDVADRQQQRHDRGE